MQGIEKVFKDSSNRIFDHNTMSDANRHFKNITPTKTPNETETAFNERLAVFYDASDIYFKGYAVKEINNILDKIAKNRIYDNNYRREYMINVHIEDYNAEKGGCFVNCLMFEDCSDDYHDSYELGKSFIKISAADAQTLKERGFLFIVEPTVHIGFDNKRLYPTQISIASKQDQNKKYTAFFNRPNARDIIFKGIELWKDNPRAKDLSYSYEDLIDEILERRKKENAAREKRQEEERRAAELIRMEEEKNSAKEKNIVEMVKTAEKQARDRAFKQIDFLDAFLPPSS